MPGGLERCALEAAAAVAAAHGVSPAGAAVISAGSNVLVRFPSAPAVARVMTGTVALHDEPRRWLRRELAVMEFLEPSGIAVSPARMPLAGPHHHDGMWMTFTEWVPDVTPAPGHRSGVTADEAREFGRVLRRLHDELAVFAGDLGEAGEVRGDIGRLLSQVRSDGAGDHDRVTELDARLAELGPSVFASGLPVQPLHGDVSLRNLLRAGGRLIWNDFEDTFRGPLEWDLASAVGSLRSHSGDPSAVTAMLTAYGWDDVGALAPFLAAQDVYGEIWGIFQRRRRAAGR